MPRRRKIVEPTEEPTVTVEEEAPVAPEPPPVQPTETTVSTGPGGYVPVTEIEYIPAGAELNPNHSVRQGPTRWDERAQANVVNVLHDLRPADAEAFLRRGAVKRAE
jgi:hypothetical protein